MPKTSEDSLFANGRQCNYLFNHLIITMDALQTLVGYNVDKVYNNHLIM